MGRERDGESRGSGRPTVKKEGRRQMQEIALLRFAKSRRGC